MRIALLGNFAAPWCTEVHLAGSFELLGHEVTRIQEGATKAVDVADLVKGHDLFAWVQTYGLAVQGGTIPERRAMVERIRELGIPSVGIHLDRWWGLAREDQITTEPWFALDWLMTADGSHEAEWAALGIRHRWMPPAVYEPECVLGTPEPRFTRDVVFVGSWAGQYHAESQHRHEMMATLRRWYPPRRLGLWPRGRQIRGQELSNLYASAKVVVGDSCLIDDRGRYFSDRIPETLGRGGLLVHPMIPGVMPDLYRPDEHLVCFEPFDWQGMRAQIERLLADPAERERIRIQGYEHVRRWHTYTVRMREVLDQLQAEGAFSAIL